MHFMTRAVSIFTMASAMFVVSVLASEPSQELPSKMSREDVKWMFHQVEKLDPTKKHLLENLQRIRPNQQEYAPKDIMDVLGTRPKIPAKYQHPSPQVPSQ